MEDGHTIGSGLFESNLLASADCDRIKGVLEKIADEGRIVANGEEFQKTMN